MLIDTTYAAIAPAGFIACGSMVLSDYDLFVFALCERKNEKNKNIKVPLCRRLKTPTA
jgi:hypothetical protein